MGVASLDVRWAWLFLDVPRDVPRAHGTAPVDWWAGITRTTPSPWRGDHDEFTTLVPADGPAWLKLQRVDDPADGGGGMHLDLDVDDPSAAAEVARAHGATIGRSVHDGVVVARSPGGFTFCLTTWSSGDASERRMSGSPRDHAGASLADQLCLDVPPDRLDRELAFWSDLGGWEVAPSSSRDEFHWSAPDGLPIRLLVQRRDEAADDDVVTGHLDLACEDRAAEVARHVDAGATVVAPGHGWTVLRDPWGRTYCCTDRSPATGST